MLENVGDDDNINVVSSSYVVDDDSTWMGENNSEFVEVMTDEGDCYLVMDCNSFE